MIIYYSMFAVTCLGYLFRSINKVSTSRKASRMEVFFVFGYIIFWTGMRDAFVDTASYISRFMQSSLENLSNLDFTFGSGFGFTIVEALFKAFISQNYHVWLMFIAIISGGCIAITFKRYCENFYYTVFLFLATTTFAWMMNGIRQFLAVSILFACTPLIEKRKGLLYCIIVLLCSTIHASCIIMLPIYFVVQKKPWKSGTIMIIIGVILVFLFTSQFTNLLDSMFEETTYAGISEKFVGDDGVNPLRCLVFSVPTVLALWGRKILSRESDEITDICVNMSILTSALYLIGMLTSGMLMGRIPVYLQLYQFILLPEIIKKCFTSKSAKILFIVSILGYAMYFYLMSDGMYYSSLFTGRIY